MGITARLCTTVATIMALSQPIMAEPQQSVESKNQVIELTPGYVENSRDFVHNVFVVKNGSKEYQWLDAGKDGDLEGSYDPIINRLTTGNVSPNTQTQYRRALHEGMQDGTITRQGTSYVVIEIQKPKLAKHENKITGGD